MESVVRYLSVAGSEISALTATCPRNMTSGRRDSRETMRGAWGGGGLEMGVGGH